MRLGIHRKPISSQRQTGAALLVVLVVIAAIILSVTLSLSLGSLGGLATLTAEERAAQSRTGADGCVEEAVLRLLWNPNYAGGMVEFGPAACVIGVTTDGSNWIIDATSTVATFVKKIRANVTVSGGQATINSWQEKGE